MPGNLVTPFTINNGQRLIFVTFGWDDDNEVLTVPIELRTSVATGAKLICAVTSVITNGACTLLSRAPGSNLLALTDSTAFFTIGSRTVATGWDAAMAVRNATYANKQLRRAALETHMGSAGAGHLDATLSYA